MFPAGAYPSPIERTFQYAENKCLKFRFPGYSELRTQEISKSYSDADQFYWGTSESWLTRSTVHGSNTTSITLERNECIDIDEIEDWEYAEYLYVSRGGGLANP